VAVSGLAGGLSEPTAPGSGGRVAACSKARGSVLQLIHGCKASFVLAKYPEFQIGSILLFLVEVTHKACVSDRLHTLFLGSSSTQGEIHLCLSDRELQMLIV
jgi:hypothetical protein